MPSKVWYEIIYTFPNFNREQKSNIIPHLIMDLITNPCLKFDHKSKMGSMGSYWQMKRYAKHILTRTQEVETHRYISYSNRNTTSHEDNACFPNGHFLWPNFCLAKAWKITFEIIYHNHRHSMKLCFVWQFIFHCPNVINCCLKTTAN